jgi:hypothetical protein
MKGGKEEEASTVLNYSQRFLAEFGDWGFLEP